MEETHEKANEKNDVFAVAVGAIIGWGCFVMPGNSFLPAAGPVGTMIGLFFAAIMAFIIAQSYGYLIRKYPVEGGEFEYTRRAFGKKTAFVCGWWHQGQFQVFRQLHHIIFKRTQNMHIITQSITGDIAQKVISSLKKQSGLTFI